MATAVYLVHYQRSRAHFRHAVRRIEAPAAAIRTLYRHIDALPTDPLAQGRGIGLVLVRTWKGQGEAWERRLKNQKHHSRLCPVCNPGGYAPRASPSAGP